MFLRIELGRIPQMVQMTIMIDWGWTSPPPCKKTATETAHWQPPYRKTFQKKRSLWCIAQIPLLPPARELGNFFTFVFDSKKSVKINLGRVGHPPPTHYLGNFFIFEKQSKSIQGSPASPSPFRLGPK